MDNTDFGFKSATDEVLKEVGKLDALTKELKEAAEEEIEEHESVAGWITTVGKALLAIFK